MSALAHVASPATKKYSTVLTPSIYPFCLPDGTKFTIQLSHSSTKTISPPQLQVGDESASLHCLRLSSHKPHEWIDTTNQFVVIPPLAAFPDPASEPNDHSLASRSKRFALGSFHGQPSSDTPSTVTQQKLWNWINVFFALWPSQEFLTLSTSSIETNVVQQLIYSGLAILHPLRKEEKKTDLSYILISRAAFWQGLGSPTTSTFSPWILPLSDSETIISLVSTNSTIATTKPFKPLASSGPLYSRFIPILNSHLTFRVASSSNSKDIDLLTEWHATDRVNQGWRQKLSREEQIKTIQSVENDAYSIGLIGEWDGEPWGYVEIYYSRQSNLKDYYDTTLRDRGFHALVGSEKFRGPHRVRSWMGSVVHLLFLLDPQTNLCVSEPRLSNTKMIQYECICGGHVEKFIDLPHKRAALVFFNKTRFFQLSPFQPLPEHVLSCQ